MITTVLDATDTLAVIDEVLMGEAVALDDLRAQLSGRLDWQCLARLRVVARSAIAALRMVDRVAELELAGLMPGRQVDVEQVGRIVRHGGPLAAKRPTWDDEMVADTLAAKAAEPFDVDPLVVSVIAGAFHECARLEWKKTALEASGVDPVPLAEWAQAPVTVQMPKPDLTRTVRGSRR